MELVSTVWHVVSVPIVFFIGLLIVNVFRKTLKTGIKRALTIYIWHTLFSLVYLWYLLNYGGDAFGYYRRATDFDFDFKFGTDAATSLTALFVHGFGQSFLGAFLIFNIFGTIGLLAFDASLRIAIQNKGRNLQYLATLIIFLPSVSFWSSAIGKDALSFMATGLALWAALDLVRRLPLMAFAVVVMLLVRPHMAAIMVLALMGAFLFDSKALYGKKIILVSIAAAVVASLIPFALKYVGAGDVVNVETLIDYIELRQTYNMDGGGGIDIASMSLPMSLFTYLFRPIIFEAKTIFALMASIDNLILLYLFIVAGYSMLTRRIRVSQEGRIFMWLYSMAAWFILSSTSANLGISLRQKWMFVPMLVFLLISVIGRRRSSSVSGPPSSNNNVAAQ
jgi:hypothetical protein